MQNCTISLCLETNVSVNCAVAFGSTFRHCACEFVFSKNKLRKVLAFLVHSRGMSQSLKLPYSCLVRKLDRQIIGFVFERIYCMSIRIWQNDVLLMTLNSPIQTYWMQVGCKCKIIHREKTVTTVMSFKDHSNQIVCPSGFLNKNMLYFGTCLGSYWLHGANW